MRGGGKNARGMAELTNAIQKFFLENSRLGIPVIFHEECLHGHAAPDGTSFPQPIALAATFDPALVERLFTMTAEEARLRGAHQALTPVVDVARDPRWGRVRRLTAKIRTWCRAWELPRCAASRAMRLPRQEACDRNAEAFRGPRAAGVGHELRAGEHLDARAARDFLLYLQGSAGEGRARSA